MRTFQLRFCIIILIASVASVGCVSVKLSQQTAQRSSRVNYLPPDSPYKKMESELADAIFQNFNTGATISYLSECQDPSDPSVESLIQAYLQSFEDGKVQRKKHVKFLSRRAKNVQIVGFIDGVEIKSQLLVFKKNGCNYTLTLVTQSKSNEFDLNQFEKFKNGFKVE